MLSFRGVSMSQYMVEYFVMGQSKKKYFTNYDLAFEFGQRQFYRQTVIAVFVLENMEGYGYEVIYKF